MLQIILTLAIFLILVIPMGKYMYHIATKQKTFADKMFNPIDNFLYKICGIKREDMGWKVRDVFSTGKCSNGIYRLFDFTITEFAVFKSERS
jgi:K+-transporting ATPase A subunit